MSRRAQAYVRRMPHTAGNDLGLPVEPQRGEEEEETERSQTARNADEKLARYPG